MRTVLITGLPRSGTSVVTKIVNALDININADMATTGDNWCPNGYDENCIAQKINTSVFREAYKSFKDDANISDTQIFYEQHLISQETREEAFNKINAKQMIINFKGNKNYNWGFKNPGCLYLLKQWSEYLDNPYIIITTRNIVKNALSQFKIWSKELFNLNHTLISCSDMFKTIVSTIPIIKCPVCFVDFETTKNNHIETALQLANFLNIKIDNQSLLQKNIDKFVVKEYSTIKNNSVIRIK